MPKSGAVQQGLDIRVMRLCAFTVDSRQFSAPKIFKRAANIKAALALVKADFKDVARILAQDQIAQDPGSGGVHVFDIGQTLGDFIELRHTRQLSCHGSPDPAHCPAQRPSPLKVAL